MTPEQARSLITAFYATEVKARKRTLTWNPMLKNSIAEVARFMTAEDNNWCGLFFGGLYGNGKTTLLMALQQVFMKMPIFTEQTYPELKVVDARSVASDYSDPKDFASLARLPLLGIEDMGREPVEVQSYGNIDTPMVRLLEQRYNRQLFTIVTTNLNGNQISERYGARIWDRFQEMLKIVIFENGSFRKQSP